ncbi:MAG: rod shape-determining protein MreD [Armatimonadota bacterium]|nr:rod shape-determining protein MreD [bacterium]
MKRYFGAIIGLIIAAGVQGNLPSSMALLGAKPDLILVVLIAYSLAEDPEFGATIGFIAGLINGCVVGLNLGSFIVTRTMTGFFAGMVSTRLFGDNPIVPMFSAMWLTLACEGLFLLANPMPDFGFVVRTLAGKCIYNGIFTLIVYAFVKHLNTHRKIRMANARL